MKKRQVNPNVYSEFYYLNHCLTLEEFKTNRGGILYKRLIKLLENSRSKEGIRVLDIGCGKGDLAIDCAKKGANVIAIDYSISAIKLARKKLSLQKKNIKNKIYFLLMDASKVDFPKNSFDIVLSIDVFEHLYPEELEIVMKKISSILKNNGELLVHTEANKIYLNFTHRWYVYPISTFLILLNKIFTGQNYPNLPKDSQNELHKIQHVNEPTYYSLVSLFRRFKFKGKIYSIVPYKPALGRKDIIYNILVWFYPFSKFWPFHLIFAYDYICIMKNKKI